MTNFKDTNGKPARVFGEAPLPKDATDIVKRQINSRVVSYVTYNKPNITALAPTGKGLELSGKSHPNDIFVNEECHFRLVLNGHHPSNLELSITKSGTKHRNQREKISMITDESGYFETKFSEPGFYLSEAEKEVKAESDKPVNYYSYSLYITFEMFPE